MREVFDRLRGANFPLDKSKCHFAQGQVEYLGHTKGRSDSRHSESKFKALRLYPRPRNIREVRSFISLSGYYHQCIRRWGTQWRSWLRHCTPDGFVEIFH